MENTAMRNERQAEISEDQQNALFARITEMKRSGWTMREIHETIAAWPADWRELVKGFRFVR